MEAFVKVFFGDDRVPGRESVEAEIGALAFVQEARPSDIHKGRE